MKQKLEKDDIDSLILVWNEMEIFLEACLDAMSSIYSLWPFVQKLQCQAHIMKIKLARKRFIQNTSREYEGRLEKRVQKVSFLLNAQFLLYGIMEKLEKGLTSFAEAADVVLLDEGIVE